MTASQEKSRNRGDQKKEPSATIRVTTMQPRTRYNDKVNIARPERKKTIAVWRLSISKRLGIGKSEYGSVLEEPKSYNVGIR